MAVLFLVAVYLLFFASQIALGQDVAMTLTAPLLAQPEIALMPDCYNVQEVLMTWGWFGKVATLTLAGLVALRPASVILLSIAGRLGPQAQGAAQLFYALGQAAAFFCPAKPAFVEKYAAPAAAKPAGATENPPEPPKAV